MPVRNATLEAGQTLAVRMHVNTTLAPPFTSFVQILEFRNEIGQTVYLSTHSEGTGPSGLPGVITDMQWTFDEPGRYSLRTFVMTELGKPEVMTPVRSSEILITPRTSQYLTAGLCLSICQIASGGNVRIISSWNRLYRTPTVTECSTLGTTYPTTHITEVRSRYGPKDKAFIFINPSFRHCEVSPAWLRYELPKLGIAGSNAWPSTGFEFNFDSRPAPLLAALLAISILLAMRKFC